MSYVVLSTDASGERRIDDVANLDAGLEQVERLRNEQGVSDIRVFREVPIEVRAYYKAVVVDEEAAPAPSGVVTELPTAPSPPPAEVESVGNGVAAEADAPTPDPGHAQVASAEFFTPPPVRTHDVDDAPEEGSAETETPHERRASLFGRG